ncbi:MAG TPA: hypothetical protein VKA27_07380, partial [Sunxiuqinia sp.]|nr:hypothetical protein [Sunxiuqinia sp.]
MTDRYEKIELLIVKKLSGEASDNEIKQLNNWLEESARNRKLYEESQRIWQKSNHYISNEQKTND